MLIETLMAAQLFIGAVNMDAQDYNGAAAMVKMTTPIMDLGFRANSDDTYKAVNLGISVNGLFNAGVLVVDGPDGIHQRGYLSKSIGPFYAEVSRDEQDTDTSLTLGILVKLN